MAYLGEKIIGDYIIIAYSVGGIIRDRLSGKEVGGWENYWTGEKSLHPKTQEQIQFIKEKLNITIPDYFLFID